MTEMSLNLPDWPSIIERLEARYSQLDIGLEVGRSEAWVCKLKAGVIRDPGCAPGLRLLALDGWEITRCTPGCFTGNVTSSSKEFRTGA